MWCRSSGRPLTPRANGEEGLSDQTKVKGQRCPADVLFSQLDFIRENSCDVLIVRVGGRGEQLCFMSVLDRREIRNARTYGENLAVIPFEQLHEFRHLRPGPDQAHVAFHDVDQLWKLIDLGGPEQASHPRHARVASARNGGTGNSSSGSHGSKLVKLESTEVTADALLDKQNVTWRIEPYRHGRSNHDRPEHREPCGRCRYVEGALDHCRPLPHRRQKRTTPAQKPAP